MSGNIVYIGIGSNLGNALENVTGAMDLLGKLPDTRLQKTSSLYRTAPVDADGDDYVNAVAMLSTTLAPEPLLEALWQIENAFGRKRPYRNAEPFCKYYGEYFNSVHRPSEAYRHTAAQARY